MSNIVKFENANLPATADSLINLAAQVAVTATGGGMDDLLRLQRDGSWAYGVDNVEPEPDVQWALNPHSFQHGFIAWVDSKVAGEVMVPVSQPLPPRSELPEIPEGEKWDDQLSVHFQCIDGEDEGQVVAFKTTSVGGRNAIGKLAGSVSAQAQVDPENVVALCIFEVDSYQHKKFGKIYTPEFKIEGWTSMGEGVDDVPEPAEVIEEEKPSRRRRARSK